MGVRGRVVSDPSRIRPSDGGPQLQPLHLLSVLMRPANRILVAVFLATLSLPLVASLGGVEGGDPGAENRELASFPTFDGTWSSAVAYLPALGRWFDDHYAFRA